MTEDDQTDGRRKNGAEPGGKPDGTTSTEAVEKTGRAGQIAAGPDGPDASAIGDTFKRRQP